MAAPGKCFLVTGPPGVGKTTLVMKVFESLKLFHPNLNIRGFYTREIRQGGERVGFEVVTLDGRRGPLASTTNSSPESIRWPAVGKYKVDLASFESLALPELQVKEHTDLFIIDEVGKMELYSSLFFPSVLRVLESNIPVLATIPIPKFGRDIPGVARLRNHPGAIVYTLNTGNGNQIKEEVHTRLVNIFQKQ
ncbi:uncharacterized protein [Aristolochia californica]|uniref:uncharacterized protein isoform X1 n=1 Tax=Aristolochia californica TaxID=171875 RepID=UPI0035DBDAE9